MLRVTLRGSPVEARATVGALVLVSAISTLIPWTCSHLSGARPPSSNSAYRPASSMSHHLRANSRAGIRPPPSVDNHPVAIDQFYPDQQNCTPNHSYIRKITPTLFLQKQRRRHDAASDPIYTPSNINRSRPPSNPFRSASISTAMQSLSLQGEHVASGSETCPTTPSYIPKPVPVTTASSPPAPVSPSKVARGTLSTKKSLDTPRFLNRHTNTLSAWDPASRFEQIEQNMKQLFDMKGSMNQAISDNSTLQEQMNLHKTRSKYREPNCV